MDLEATRRIQPALEPAERLLWAGRPVQGVVFRATDRPTTVLGLLWAGFALSWVYTGLTRGQSLPVLAFGLVFVLIGLYLALGRLVVDAYARRHIYYGVTDRRIVFAEGRSGPDVQFLNLDTITDVTLKKRASDGGVIAFRSTGPFRSPVSSSWPGLPHLNRPEFELAKGASNTYQIIRSAVRNAT
jgi:hypothetical protein